MEQQAVHFLAVLRNPTLAVRSGPWILMACGNSITFFWPGQLYGWRGPPSTAFKAGLLVLSTISYREPRSTTSTDYKDTAPRNSQVPG